MDVPEDSHLRRLAMGGVPTASSGFYTPHGVELSLNAVDRASDQIVYVHEVHHAALNDSTAWGAALHLAARLPGWLDVFENLLDDCRTLHESYATFASVTLVRQVSPDATAVLHAYPRYRRLHEQFRELVGDAGGSTRTYLAATAIARVCMQTPILTRFAGDMAGIAGAWRDVEDLPEIDVPDGRYGLLRSHSRVVTDAIGHADDLLETSAGSGVNIEDETAESTLTPGHADIDTARTLWETACYSYLATFLREQGADVLAYDGHTEPSARLVARLAAVDSQLRLRTPLRDTVEADAALASAIVEPISIALTESRAVASLIRVSAAQIVDATPPGFVIVDARLPLNLLDHFVWDPYDEADLRQAKSRPVLAARLYGETDDGSEVIAHAVLTAPTDVRMLRQAWPAEQLMVTCVAASCLIDTSWRDNWLPALRACGPLVFLIDIELRRLLPAWNRSRALIDACLLEIADTAGSRHALLLKVQDVAWVAISNDVGVRLMLQIVQATEGATLRVRSQPGPSDLTYLPGLLEHLLATEQYLALDGLAHYT